MFRTAVALALAAGALIAQPAGRASYAARRTGDVVQLEDSRARTSVSIIPSVGNIAFRMDVNGRNILYWPFASVEEFKRRPAMSGIPFVGPWANRLDEPAFFANGTKYAFDMALGNVRGLSIPIHGFLTTTNEWRASEAKADAGSAWATSRLDVFRRPEWMKQWPFAHTVEMTHRLRDGALEVHTKIANMSADPMPVAIGFHPYFRLTDSSRNDWRLSVAAHTHWRLASNKIPTGETEPADPRFVAPHAAALVDYDLDDVFGDLIRDAQGRATMSVIGVAQRLDVVLGPNYRAVVIWAPKDAGFICIEPMAAITDALNLAQRRVYAELQTIPSGAAWEESFWIRPSGF